MLRRSLILLSAIWILSGCASLTTLGVGARAPIPEEDLVPCPKPSLLKSGSHQAVEEWAVQAGSDYQRCVALHDKLIDKVRERQGQPVVKK